MGSKMLEHRRGNTPHLYQWWPGLVEIRRSSGSTELDRAAIQTMQRAAPFSPPQPRVSNTSRCRPKAMTDAPL
ncbi:MAG: energy transducer TonB [Pseudomonadota bacterium]